MATLAQLENALRNADAAGDMDAARKLAAAVASARKDRSNLIPGGTVPGTTAQPEEPGLIDTAIGTGEAALTAATGAVGGALGMVGGTIGGMAGSILSGEFGTPQALKAVEEAAMKGAEQLTYQPRTQSGREQVQALGEVAQQFIPVTPLTAEMGMLARGAKASAPAVSAATAAGAQRVAAPIAAAGAKVAEAVKREPAASVGQSVGAAATPAELQRTATAEKLGFRLTEGERTRNPEQMAFEKEYIKDPEAGAPLRERAEEHNTNVLRNLEKAIDETGTNVGDPALLGDPLTKTLARGYREAKNKTNSAYDKAMASPEAQAAVDVQPILDFLNERPAGIASEAISDAAKTFAVRIGIAQADDAGNLVALPATVERMELFRREVGNAPSLSESNQMRQAGQIKRLIDNQTEPVAGPLFKRARLMRVRQAQKYENRAIVSDLIKNKLGKDDRKVALEKVFDRAVLNGSAEDLTFLKRVLRTNRENGNQAWRDIQGATVAHIRDVAAAGYQTDSAGRPMVSGAKLNQVIDKLDNSGKLNLIFGNERAQMLRDLNEVQKYITTVPPGTLVNTSGTSRALLGAIGEMAASGAIIGMPVPAITLIKAARSQIKDNRIKAKIVKALAQPKQEN